MSCRITPQGEVPGPNCDTPEEQASFGFACGQSVVCLSAQGLDPQTRCIRTTKGGSTTVSVCESFCSFKMCKYDVDANELR